MDLVAELKIAYSLAAGKGHAKDVLKLCEQYEQLQAKTKRYENVIEKCIKSMEGSNCMELEWLEKAIKENKNG